MNNILSNIILLAQVEQFPDLSNSLGSKTTGCGDIGKSGDFSISLPHDNEIQNTEIKCNDDSNLSKISILSSGGNCVK